jgi:hypothetical protein
MAPEGAGAGAAAATGSGAGAGAGAAATGAGAGAGAAAAGAAAAGALGSSITPMMFSDTPAFFSFTKSAGVRSSGLLSLFNVRMIKASDNPALTDSITESTGEGAAFVAAFAGAAFGAALDAGACAKATPATKLPNTTKPNAKLNVNDLNFM